MIATPTPLPADLALEAMLPKTYLGVPTRRSSFPVVNLTYGNDGCLFVCDYDLAAYIKKLGVDDTTMTGAVALPGGPDDLILVIGIRSPGIATDKLVAGWLAARSKYYPDAGYPTTVAGKSLIEAYFGPCNVWGTQYLYAADDVLFIVLDAGYKDYAGCENPSAAITDAISQLP